MRILVVEDEQDLLESLVEGLRLNSYAVDGCDDGCKAHELVSVVEYDLVVLDLNLPGMDGFQLLREIRTVNAEVKVLILSARDGLEDKVRGLDAGANDYLTKPFHFAELEARVRGLLRRRFTQQDRLLTFRGVMLDTAAHAVEAAGQPLTLTRKEYALLEYLLLHPSGQGCQRRGVHGACLGRRRGQPEQCAAGTYGLPAEKTPCCSGM